MTIMRRENLGLSPEMIDATSSKLGKNKIYNLLGQKTTTDGSYTISHASAGPGGSFYNNQGYNAVTDYEGTSITDQSMK